MNHYLNYIKTSILKTLVLVLPYTVITLVIYIGYRIDVYGYIQSIYSDFQALGTVDYVSLSLYYDARIIFVSLLVLFFIALLTVETKKLKYYLISVYLAAQTAFIVMCIEFFRVYETTFHSNFISDENFSGLWENIYSAFSEFSGGMYVKLSIISLLIAVTSYRAFKRKNAARNMGPIRYFSPGLFPFLLAILLAIIAAADLDLKYRGIAEKFNGRPANVIQATLNEFSMNPIYNLFFTPVEPEKNSALLSPKKGEFTFRFNTDSKVSKNRHPRTNIIPRGKKYNIIFYFFESYPCQYRDIQVNGKYVTPTWRKLEKHSLVMKKHYANYPLSANALLTILTSAYDTGTREMVIQKHPYIRLRSAPEILKEQGYRTAVIHTGGLGYANQYNFLKKRKFDMIMEYKQLIKIPPYNYEVGWGVDERAMIRPAVEFIKKDMSSPFFMILLPVNPHHPYAIPEKKFQITGPVPKNASGKEKNWLNYLNSLYFSDFALGELIKKLEQEKLMENTLLFLFADHGEAFYQHRRNYNHPLYIYEENVHIPFLIYNKKIFKETVYFDGVTRHIDILPTLLDILKIRGDLRQEGVSIVKSHREQFALLQTTWKDDYVGIRDGKWKYIYRVRDGVEELYDLSKDPREQNNIAASEKETAKLYRETALAGKQYKIRYYKNILKK